MNTVGFYTLSMSSICIYSLDSSSSDSVDVFFLASHLNTSIKTAVCCLSMLRHTVTIVLQSKLDVSQTSLKLQPWKTTDFFFLLEN